MTRTWEHDRDGWWTMPGADVVQTLHGAWAWSANGRTGEHSTRFGAQAAAERALRARVS